MANETTQENIIDWDEKKGKIPSMLNVLTILTLIWCGLGVIFAIFGYTGAQKNYDNMPDNLSKLENAPSFAKKMMGPDPLEFAHRSLENRMPILLLSLVGLALCAYGAIQMRKLQKAGFWIYVIGELPLPMATIGIFLGFGLMAPMSLWLGLLIPVVFIILYGTQLKYMK